MKNHVIRPAATRSVNLRFLLLLLVLVGCAPAAELPTLTPTTVLPSATAVSPTRPPVTSTPHPLTLPSPTTTSVPLPTRQPTAEPATITTVEPPSIPTEEPLSTPTEEPPLYVTSIPAGEVAHEGVRFQLNSLLANQIYFRQETWGDLTYNVFMFAPEGLCREVGCIEVYDVAAYEAAYPDLSLPPLGAATILSAQKQALTFQNGRGSRTVLMRGQDGYFANNEALLYEFQGFTEDGHFYILVTIPIDAPILLSTYDPAQNSNPDAISVPAELPTDYSALSDIMFEYNQEVRQRLEELVAAEFAPSLDLLDELVASLHVE